MLAGGLGSPKFAPFLDLQIEGCTVLRSPVCAEPTVSEMVCAAMWACVNALQSAQDGTAR